MRLPNPPLQRTCSSLTLGSRPLNGKVVRWADSERWMTAEEASAIEEQWSCLLKADDARLRAIVCEAARYPNLRRLFPFASLSNLHFSRATSYPYDHLPFILVTPFNEHEARGSDNAILGRGPLADMVRVVAEAIGDL